MKRRAFLQIPLLAPTAQMTDMENGKIAEERDFLDNLELYQQLGLIPR